MSVLVFEVKEWKARYVCTSRSSLADFQERDCRSSLADLQERVPKALASPGEADGIAELSQSIASLVFDEGEFGFQELLNEKEKRIH